MIRTFAFVMLVLVNGSALAQVVQCTVVNAANSSPLIYASAGVVGTDRGMITDERGVFKLNLQGLPPNALVRFSMIGYKSASVRVSDLKDNTTIRLQEEPIALKEIVVDAKAERTRLGTYTTTKRHLTGWGGFGVGAGGERAIRVESKKYPVLVMGVGFVLARSAYDSVLFRVHVRSLEDGLPSGELLPENVFITFRKPSGEGTVNLSKYNLTFEKPFVVSMEWVKAWGNCGGAACFLQFSVNPSKGILYSKEASEGKWKIFEKQSPAIFAECRY